MLSANGIRLRFDGSYQRLYLIEIVDFSRCLLTFRGYTLNKSGKITYHTMYNAFGATKAGNFNNGIYTLEYQTLGVTFKLSESPENIDTVLRLSNENASALAVAFDFNDFLIKRTFKVWSIVIDDIKTSACVNNHSILIGKTTPQLLIKQFGPPDEIYEPEINDEIMEGVLGGTDNEKCYFFNYFSLGIGVLIWKKTHRVGQIIFHRNIPTSPEFSRWTRVIWKLQITKNVCTNGLDLQSETDAITIIDRLNETFYAQSKCTPFFLSNFSYANGYNDNLSTSFVFVEEDESNQSDKLTVLTDSSGLSNSQATQNISSSSFVTELYDFGRIKLETDNNKCIYRVIIE